MKMEGGDTPETRGVGEANEKITEKNEKKKRMKRGER